MQFLTLYTPSVKSSGPRSDEHATQMKKCADEMHLAGVLVATGGILSRDTGMKVTLNNGKFSVFNGAAAGSSLMPAAGWAVMRADSREALVKHIQTFLTVAGDGTSEVIQIMDEILPQKIQ